MAQEKSPPMAFRHPFVALSAVFSASLAAVVVLIVYSQAMSAQAMSEQRFPQVPQQAGLEIENHVQDKVLAYEQLTYTVAFTNTSGGLLQNVRITSTWATDTDYPSNPPLAEYNGNLYDPQGVVDAYTWTVGTGSGALYITVGDLGVGAAANLVFTMGVPDSLEPNYKDPRIGPTVLGNSVDIGTTTPNVDNANDTDATLIVGPVLKLVKTVQTEGGIVNKERPGRLLTYTLTLDNLDETDGRGDSWPASWVEIWEDLPAELTLVDAQPPGMWTYIAASRRISWTLPSDFVLQPGHTTAVTFTARITTTKADYSLNNKKTYCWTMAAERLTPVKCDSDRTVTIMSPLEKQVQTRNPPTASNETYPNRIITYTVYVYNPLQIQVNDVRVTDTLPAQYFTYQGMVQGPTPLGSPTNTVVWAGLSLPANGVISLTFNVFVDPHTPVSADCSKKEYKNQLWASSAAFPVVYEDDSFSTPHVKVVKQIVLTKSVLPTKQLPGEVVTYTIGIENEGDTSIQITTLTDTLPIDFRYDSMVSGTPGEPAGQSDNVIWWRDIPSIGAGQTFQFSFHALVDGEPLSKYKNKVNGFSPDTYICGINTAEVQVLSPIVGSKLADPPHPIPIVQGESFEYSVSYANQSRLQSYFATAFVDLLPVGFEKDGNQLYEYTIDPMVELLPNQANNWEHTFDVQIVGEGAGTTWCNDLASEDKRKVYQLVGMFGVHTTDLPEGWYWLNAAKEAPVYVKPHVDLLHAYYPSKVAVSGTTTVTLTLSNNLRSPTQPVDDISVTYAKHADFTYLGVLPGTPEPDIVGDNLVWSGIDLPASGQVQLRFQLRAPAAPKDYSGIQAYAAAANPDICIPLKTATINVVKGVVLKKTPTPKEIGPFGTVEYNLQVTNKTNAPVSGIRVTDTLPFGFEFIEMTSSHVPVSTAPLVWEIPYITAEGKENIVFKVRAYVNLGPQYNLIEGISASTYVTLEKKLEDYLNDVKVEVMPGVGLYKTAQPGQIQAGAIVTYSITLYNGSTKNMANIVLTDTLPNGFSFVEMVEGDAPSQVQGQQVVWQVSRLDKTKTLKLIFHASTQTEMPSGAYYNQVVGEAWDAASPYGMIDVPGTDLTAPVIVQGLPTVRLNKSVSPASVIAGNLVTYTITLYNETDQAVTLRLTDTLPLSVTFDSVVGATPAPAQTAPVVWGSIVAGSQQTVTLSFRAWVDLYARSGTYYNHLEAATDAFQLPPSGPLAPLTVEEIPRYDLQISKDDGNVTVDEGQLLLYTITYTNANDADVTLTNVVITDTFSPLPPYATLFDPRDWEVAASNVYTHWVGDLGPGASGSVQFRLQLSDTIPADVWVISNTVDIGHSTAVLAFESDPSNNSSTDLDILRGPDLVLGELQVSPQSLAAGEPITFALTVRNQGKDNVVNASNTSAGWFIVELYLKKSGFTPAGPPVNVFDHVGGWYPDAGHSQERMPYMCIPAGLPAGDEMVCTFVITDIVAADAYQVYAQADVTFDYLWNESYGMVIEAIESNNISAYGAIQVGSQGSLYLPLVTKNH
jgi:uncharacterized repeat protein (TIGR01451 family)